MSYSFVNSPAVKVDVIEATAYYKKVNPKIARQFLERIREARKFIGNNPLGFQTKYGIVRTVLLKQFPYHIHYIIDEDRRQIVIIAIIHAYRNPKDYLKR